MGSIAQFFESGEQSSQKGHFRNLVMLARVDGAVGEEELALLMRIAKRLSLTEEQVIEIRNDKNNYPMVPPSGKEERYERLINLVKMTFVDGEVITEEEKLVRRYAYALGFDQEQFETIYPKILELVIGGKTRDEILETLM
jgi:uncharacterized tellurite resistance protein B-like protein